MPRKVKRSSTKRRSSSSRRKMGTIKMKGGAGYTLTDCKIGGLSEVRAYSECPQKVGPLSPDFAKALYTDPILFGGGGSKRRRSSPRKSQSPLTTGFGCGA